MSSPTAARAVITALTAAYNPHQQRGPDGAQPPGKDAPLLSGEPLSGGPAPEAPQELLSVTEGPRDAALTHRARAAAAAIKMLLAFNPHQRRGPDGRWIRMPTSELKQPRRPRRPRAAKPKPPRGNDTPPINLPEPDTDYRERRDEYNAQVMFYAEGRLEPRPGSPVRDLNLEHAINNVRLATSPNAKDDAVDRLRSLLDAWHGAEHLLDPKPVFQDVPLPNLPPGPRTDGGPRPPTTAPYQRRRDALDTSIRSGIDGQDVLGGGVMGDTRRFKLADGTQAIYKRAKAGWRGWSVEDQTDAEELASLVAAAIGAPAPAVQRATDTELYMEVVPGVTAGARGWFGGAPEEVLETDDAIRIGLLDVLLSNTDRHAGNWMVDGEQIYAIDHGLAFRSREIATSAATGSPFVNAFIDRYSGDYHEQNLLSPSDIDYLRGRLKELEPRFEALNRGEWLDDVQARLGFLSRGAFSTESLYPEAAEGRQ